MMSGCKECSGCSPQPSLSTTKKAEKLEKRELSGNPRYPLLLVGMQAMYSENGLRIIVTVVADECDETCDSFTLKAQRILKDPNNVHRVDDSFQVTQEAGAACWKLQALI